MFKEDAEWAEFALMKKLRYLEFVFNGLDGNESPRNLRIASSFHKVADALVRQPNLRFLCVQTFDMLINQFCKLC